MAGGVLAVAMLARGVDHRRMGEGHAIPALVAIHRVDAVVASKILDGDAPGADMRQVEPACRCGGLRTRIGAAADMMRMRAR